MELKDLQKKHELINLFVELCKIPSPPLKEQAVSEKILQIFLEHKISAEYDSYKNVIAKIPGKGKFKNIQPILLSAHMDVVGGSERIVPVLSKDGKYIQTDKTRTLGADNKAGVAAIMDVAFELSCSETDHAPVEITFTRDEEKGMSGMRSLDSSILEAKYAVIADGETLGELDSEGAGFTNVFVNVYDGKGGHSGINIHENDRVSAVKALCDFASGIPQGVYKHDSRKGVVTSINAGVCIGGSADTFISEILKDVYELAKGGNNLPAEYSPSEIFETISSMSALNTITSSARISYSIRSSEPENEQELISLIKTRAGQFNSKYNGLIKIDVDVKYHLMPFVKNNDDFLEKVVIEAGKKIGINSVPSSFHAGAETHILSREKQNRHAEFFNPVIIGVANLESIHSADEKIDWSSFLEGRKWLKEIVSQYGEKTLSG